MRLSLGSTFAFVIGPLTCAAFVTAACGGGTSKAADDEGARVYARLCVNCHRVEGRGSIGEVPPLLRHFPEVLGAGGRRYLIRAVLYGLEGPITASGRDYAGLMTPMSYMKDTELAAVLNHVARSWGNEALLPADFVPFRPEEIAAERRERFRPREVRSQRPQALDVVSEKGNK